jgi:hypothetical protein
MRIAPRYPSNNHFWSTGNAFGTLTVGSTEAVLHVREGLLHLTELHLPDLSPIPLPTTTLAAGTTLRLPL